MQLFHKKFYKHNKFCELFYIIYGYIICKTFYNRRIFILTVMVGLSGCASDTDSDTQVSSRAYSMQMKQNQNRVQTFNGRRQIRSSDGSMWTPPAGSYQDKDGYILDKDGTTIGQTGPLKIPKDAVG